MTDITRATSARLIATTAAAACGIATAAALIGAAPAGAATSRPTVRMHVTHTHHVAGPSRLHPGITKFTNTGKAPILVLSKKSKGASELAADLRAADSKRGPAALLRDFTVRDALDPGQSAYLGLRRGTLYLVGESGRPTAASVRTVRVAGSTRNASVPASRTFTMSNSRHLTVQSPVPHGAVVHVVNKTSSVQFLFRFRLSDHVSDADIAAFNAKPSEAGLKNLHPVDFEQMAMLSGHRSMWAVLPNTRSVYAVASSGLNPRGHSLHIGEPSFGMFSAE